MTDPDSRSPGPPLIVRVAGLPADTITPFASPEAASAARALADLEDRLDDARARAVDRLYDAVHGAPADARRALLAVKRDLYNGRDLHRTLESPAWAVFADRLPDAARELAELAQDIEARRSGFETLLGREHERERSHLATVAEDEGFRQGLCLASPVLEASLGRLRAGRDPDGRKQRRLEESLLRYVSRAALKLSPFSTLTRLGLARAIDHPETEEVLALSAAEPAQRELRRLRKHMVVKYFSLLADHPPIRRRLTVTLNPTIQATEPGRYRFIEPFHWRLNREAQEFRFFEEAVVSVKLKGPLVETLLRDHRGPERYDRLVETLCATFGQEPGLLEPLLDRFIEIGFLLLAPPWETNAFDPERRFAAFLRADDSGDPLSATFAAHLDELLDLRDRQAPVAERARDYAVIERRRLDGFAALAEALPLPPVDETRTGRHLNEDVFLWTPDEDRPGDPDGSVATVDRASVEQALRSVRPLAAYSDLNYTRYELLHSLAALAAERWPGRSMVGFLDLFHAAQPLWQSFLKASIAAVTEYQRELWNPYGLATIDELQGIRDRVHREMSACMEEVGDELVLDLAGAEAAARHIPDRYRPAFDPCLFAQPVSPRGDRWVLNHMLDGTGRFSNRYTTVMPPEMARGYSEHLARAARVTLADSGAEMVEILCARDDHLNVHRVQTDRVIALPGEVPTLPPERCLGLEDLQVGFDGPLPVLLDAEGRTLMPIFLGTNGLVGMPMPVRFLSQFGIGECRVIHPPRRPRSIGGMSVQPRLRIGNLVLRRKLWTFSPAAVLGNAVEAPEPDFYRAVQRWRRDHGVPERAYVAERLDAAFTLWPLYKPQYVDFTSPSFVRLFHAAVRTSPEELKMEEALPEPGAFPTDHTGRSRAVEAQLESLSFASSEPRDDPFRVAVDRLPIPGVDLSTREPWALTRR